MILFVWDSSGLRCMQWTEQASRYDRYWRLKQGISLSRGSHSRDGVRESMFERDSFYLSDSLLTLIAGKEARVGMQFSIEWEGHCLKSISCCSLLRGSGRKPIKELDFWFENQEEKELLHMARSIPYHNTRRLAVPKEEGKGDPYNRGSYYSGYQGESLYYQCHIDKRGLPSYGWGDHRALGQ